MSQKKGGCLQFKASPHDFARMDMDGGHRSHVNDFIGDEFVGRIQKQYPHLFVPFERHHRPQVSKHGTLAGEEGAPRDLVAQDMVHRPRDKLQGLFDFAGTVQKCRAFLSWRRERAPKRAEAVDQAN